MTRAPRAFVRSLVLAQLVITACGAAITHDATPRAAEAAASEPSSGAEPAAVVPTPHCDAVTKSKRTYVGLSDGMTLDDFGDAAYESERIIDAVRAGLCTAQVGELEPALEHAIASTGVEVVEVQFTRDDMSAARAKVRTRSPAAPASAAEIVVYRIDVARGPTAWTLVSIARE